MVNFKGRTQSKYKKQLLQQFHQFCMCIINEDKMVIENYSFTVAGWILVGIWNFQWQLSTSFGCRNTFAKDEQRRREREEKDRCRNTPFRWVFIWLGSHGGSDVCRFVTFTLYSSTSRSCNEEPLPSSVLSIVPCAIFPNTRLRTNNIFW